MWHLGVESWPAWTLGMALGVASGSGITPLGWFRIPNQHLHVQLHGVERRGETSPCSVTSIFNSLVPRQFHASFISWNQEFSPGLDSAQCMEQGEWGAGLGITGTATGMVPSKPGMELSHSHRGVPCPKGVPNPAWPWTLLSSLRTQLKKPAVLLPPFPV